MENELKVIALEDGNPDAGGLYEQYKLAKEDEAAYCGFKFEIAYLYNKDVEFYFYERVKSFQYKRLDLELEKGLEHALEKVRNIDRGFVSLFDEGEIYNVPGYLPRMGNSGKAGKVTFYLSGEDDLRFNPGLVKAIEESKASLFPEVRIERVSLDTRFKITHKHALDTRGHTYSVEEIEYDHTEKWFTAKENKYMIVPY